MRVELLPDALAAGDGPTIVCAQVGNVNTGSCDDVTAIADAVEGTDAWLHVDGAFGLWAAASPRLRHLVAGVERADSWATDAHKWLNVPYDSGIAFCADPEAHRAAMSVRASYLEQADADAARDQMDWNPEFSRRARGFPIYAAIRALGRDGHRGDGRALLRPRSALRGAARRGAGRRDPERRRPQPGARPVRRRRRADAGDREAACRRTARAGSPGRSGRARPRCGSRSRTGGRATTTSSARRARSWKRRRTVAGSRAIVSSDQRPVRPRGRLRGAVPRLARRTARRSDGVVRRRRRGARRAAAGRGQRGRGGASGS